jgi:putative transposase
MALSKSALSNLADALKSADGLDLVREAVRFVFQELIEAEVAEMIGAGLYERSDTRTNERNGHPPMAAAVDRGGSARQPPHQRSCNAEHLTRRQMLFARGRRQLRSTARHRYTQARD